MTPQLSILICAHNPPASRLQRVLDRLAAQQPSVPCELIVVDNNSEPAVETLTLQWPEQFPRRVIRETQQGLTHARRRGFREARGALICCVDDDNLLHEGFLETAHQFANKHRDIGVFAGRAIGEFERQPGWFHAYHIARYAIRDLGDEPLFADGKTWSPAEPFGAGMVLRRSIAEHFAAMVEGADGDGGLGRSGTSLASGEDSLISRLAARLGYRVAYVPGLGLDHVIAPGRLTLGYALKLIRAQAQSRVVIDRITGTPELEACPPQGRDTYYLIRRFFSRLRSTDIREAISHVYWDLGYWEAQRTAMSTAQQHMHDYLADLQPEAPATSGPA